MMPWPQITLIVVVDIVVTAFLIYQFLLMVRGRRAAQVLAGLTVLLGLYGLARVGNLELLRRLLETMAPYSAFGLIVVFQSEIRRVLAQLGRKGWTGFGGRMKRQEFVEEILGALEQLARTRTGALIVLERYSGLRSFIESGVALDAALSQELLVAIFQPRGALHDGAVIVQNERISAAACFLPLSMNPALLSTLGTRHRAAIGITEETDALALVVSEETGTLSVAAFGLIDRELTIQQVEQLILEHMGGRTRQQALGEDHDEADEPGPERAPSSAPMRTRVD
ncbi:MAG: diadenylate cyclase CdaA [Bryobacteraceae bacterium]